MVCGMNVGIKSDQTGYADAFGADKTALGLTAFNRAVMLNIKYVSLL